MNKNEVTSLRRQSGVRREWNKDAEFILQTYLYMLAFYCASHTWDISDPFPDRSKDFLAPPILRKLKNQMTTKTLLRTSQTDFHDFSRFNTIKVYNSSPPRSTPILCQYRPENWAKFALSGSGPKRQNVVTEAWQNSSRSTQKRSSNQTQQKSIALDPAFRSIFSHIRSALWRHC